MKKDDAEERTRFDRELMLAPESEKVGSMTQMWPDVRIERMGRSEE